MIMRSHSFRYSGTSSSNYHASFCVRSHGNTRKRLYSPNMNMRIGSSTILKVQVPPLPYRLKHTALNAHDTKAIPLTNSNNKNKNINIKDDIEREMEQIQTKIQKLTNNPSMNLHSRKDISSLINGRNERMLSSTCKISLLNYKQEYPNDTTIGVCIDSIVRFRSLHARLRQKRGPQTQPLIQEEILQLQEGSSSNASPPVAVVSPPVSNNDSTPSPGMESIQFHPNSQHESSAAPSSKSIIEALFQPQSKHGKVEISSYWKGKLLQIEKPSAKVLLSQLSPHCPFGYHPNASPQTKEPTVGAADDATKKGSLVHYLRKQKKQYPHAIILTRIGEFYECYGIDALLLVQHCGLNPMGGKAKAGCPIKNIQATLNDLTAVGLKIAVFEEANDTFGGYNTAQKKRLKERFLSQIVTPSQPTYLYGFVLSDEVLRLDDAAHQEDSKASLSGTSHMGIIETATDGYTIVQVSLEDRTVRVKERWTKEAMFCYMQAFPPADPIFYLNYGRRRTSNTVPIPNGMTTSHTIHALEPTLVSTSLKEYENEAARSMDIILTALLDTEQGGTTATSSPPHSQSPVGWLSTKDFTFQKTTPPTSSSSKLITPQPLHLETAKQLGILTTTTPSSSGIPCILTSTVGTTAPYYTKQFIRKWLLLPPALLVTSAMATLVKQLRSSSTSTLPAFSMLPLGKVITLLRTNQANKYTFCDIVSTTTFLLQVLMNQEDDFLRALFTILEYEIGIGVPQSSSPSYGATKDKISNAIQACKDTITRITNTIITDGIIVDQISTSAYIPQSFFDRNEASWRNKVYPSKIQSSYDNVQFAVEELSNVIQEDFGDCVIMQDIFDNLLSTKQKPITSSSDGVDTNEEDKYHHPRDRNGKVLHYRYTTHRMEEALSNYIEACQIVTNEVTAVLCQLSSIICNGDSSITSACSTSTSSYLPVIIQAAHANLILCTVYHHAKTSIRQGWNMAHIKKQSDQSQDTKHYFDNVWPYWMHKSEHAISNTFHLNHIFCITAPNMSGKSTLMRSTASSALLSICGFAAPLSPHSYISPFDTLFVRGASTDIPIENKSAFGAEMSDVTALLQFCGCNSLVFVDELGRGTSPKDGTSLAAAVLEHMAECRMVGMFATHLHGIVHLPMNTDIIGKGIVWKCFQAYKEKMDADTHGDWAYKLTDGICNDSLAYKTAAKFGVPDKIVQRAQFFGLHLNDVGLLSSHEHNTQHNKNNHNTNTNDPQQSTTTTISSSTLKDAVQMLEQMVPNETSILIPPDYLSPPSLEGHSCVYILQINKNPTQDLPNTNTNTNEPQYYYYVGETDSISKRIAQHRQTYGKRNITVAVLGLPHNGGGKSVARDIESRIIRRMAQSGLFRMISVRDGYRF